jgi:hypothetical protein
MGFLNYVKKGLKDYKESNRPENQIARMKTQLEVERARTALMQEKARQAKMGAGTNVGGFKLKFEPNPNALFGAPSTNKRQKKIF